MKNNTNIKHTQQSSIPTLPKYGIFLSLQHMMGAVKKNPATFGVAILASYVISGVILFLISLAAVSLALGGYGLLFASFSKMVITFIAGLIIYTLLYAFIYAFTVSCTAYSLSDEKYGISTTLKKALR